MSWRGESLGQQDRTDSDGGKGWRCLIRGSGGEGLVLIECFTHGTVWFVSRSFET